MISARIFIFAAMLIKLIYNEILSYVADVQRKKPLPEEVADVYDAERYQTYLDYTADIKKLRNKFKIIDLVIECILIFSPIYSYIDKAVNSNPYSTFFCTYALIWIAGMITEVFASYEITFGILEKYGINKKDKKEFVKDFVLEQVLNLFVTVILMLIAIYVGEHMAQWTNGFSVGLLRSLIICALVAAVIVAFICIAQLLSYVVLRKQYTFTEMEEGDLKDKINKLQEGSKKKVKKIYIYNESKKTTTKNAFLLKLLWHKEFGIADNFMNENAEDELLAVLSHEVGHLKHKKDIRNFISYGIKAIAAIVAVMLVANPSPCFIIHTWIRDSFNVSYNNYYLIFIVYGYIAAPIMFFVQIFEAYRSRYEEYEADREAVNNGYGEALIKTFKTLSSDELVNVNPHPFIEFTEYDHPGMYQRIRAIKNAEKLR